MAFKGTDGVWLTLFIIPRIQNHPLPEKTFLAHFKYLRFKKSDDGLEFKYGSDENTVVEEKFLPDIENRKKDNRGKRKLHCLQLSFRTPVSLCDQCGQIRLYHLCTGCPGQLQRCCQRRLAHIPSAPLHQKQDSSLVTNLYCHCFSFYCSIYEQLGSEGGELFPFAI